MMCLFKFDATLMMEGPPGHSYRECVLFIVYRLQPVDV